MQKLCKSLCTFQSFGSSFHRRPTRVVGRLEPLTLSPSVQAAIMRDVGFLPGRRFQMPKTLPLKTNMEEEEEMDVQRDQEEEEVR